MNSILIVIDSLGSGGAQNQATMLGCSLADRGYTVEFCIYHDFTFFEHRLNEKNIPIHLMKKRGKLGWNVISGLKDLLNTRNYDIALSFLETPNFYLGVANKLSHAKTKCIISERFITHESWFTPKIIAKKVSHTLSDMATTNSHHERNRLVTRKITSLDKIVTIYNGVDTDKYLPSDCDFENKSCYSYICVASISPYKNGLLLVEAMHLAKKRNKLNFNVHWYGQVVRSISSRAEYYDLMLAKIEEYEIQDNWFWHKPSKELHNIYPEHDALLHPSYQEGLPNVVCEALSSGLPIMVGDVLDHAILVDKSNNGFLFDHQDAESLLLAILKFQNTSVSEKRSLSENSRAYALKELAYASYVDSYISLFQKLVV